MEDSIQNIEETIALGKTGEAMMKLLDFTRENCQHNKSLIDEAILLESYFNRKREEIRNGLLSDDDVNLVINRSNQNVLAYLKRLRKEVQEQSYQTTDTSDTVHLTLDTERQFFQRKYYEKREGLDVDLVCRAEQIEKSFAGNELFLLDKIDLSLRLGNINAVVGENAVGKTTLLRIIAGELAKDEGSLTYPHLQVNGQGWFSIKSQIAFIPQILESWEGTMKENLHFMAAIKGIKGQDNLLEVDWILGRLRLRQYQNFRWHELSSGYRMRFELAKMLVWRPKLLLLDEPLAHLDINSIDTFLSDLRKICNSKTFPIAILLSSQHIHAIERICDYIHFLKEGKQIFHGTLRKVRSLGEENIFELRCNGITKAKLHEAMAGLPIRKIEYKGDLFQISTPGYYSGNNFLKDLVAANISINYFREIHNSVKQLFR